MSRASAIQRARRRRLAFRAIGALLRNQPAPSPYVYPGPPKPNYGTRSDWRLAA